MGTCNENLSITSRVGCAHVTSNNIDVLVLDSIWLFFLEITLMKGQLLLLRRLLRTVLSAENFEQLNNAVVSARKWRSKLSRYDQLVLLRGINNKINSYV